MHRPVLLEEVIKYLSPKASNVYPHTKNFVPEGQGIYVDATVGGGGHAEKILEGSSPGGKLVGIDIDPFMLNLAKKRLKKFGERCMLIEDNYVNLPKILSKLKISEVNGIVLDLGVATEHFMRGERGFSLMREGPLDMRLSPYGKFTAADIVNKWKPEDLVNILRQYGEEHRAKKIVKNIITEREKEMITTTTQLTKIVVGAVSCSKKRYTPTPKSLVWGYTPTQRLPGYRIHPATKTFQALRIAVNNELKNIKRILPIAVDLLKIGGRICVITFHSLEDRLVKDGFRQLARSCICPKEIPRCVCKYKPKIKLVTKKPVVPEEEEIKSNPRSRSAKLRVVERI